MNLSNAIAAICLDSDNRVGLWKARGLEVPFMPKVPGKDDEEMLQHLLSGFCPNIVVEARCVFSRNVRYGEPSGESWDFYLVRAMEDRYANLQPDFWWRVGTSCEIPFNEGTQEVLRRWIDDGRFLTWKREEMLDTLVFAVPERKK